MNSREVIKRITKAGWFQIRQEGSHCHFRHESRPGLTTVPHPKSEIPIGTLKNIEKQSGVSLR